MVRADILDLRIKHGFFIQCQQRQLKAIKYSVVMDPSHYSDKRQSDSRKFLATNGTMLVLQSNLGFSEGLAGIGLGR